MLKVENGKITNIEFTSKTENAILSQILNSLKGLLHKEEEINKFVENNLMDLELAGVNTVLFSKAFFS